MVDLLGRHGGEPVGKGQLLVPLFVSTGSCTSVPRCLNDASLMGHWSEDNFGSQVALWPLTRLSEPSNYFLRQLSH